MLLINWIRNSGSFLKGPLISEAYGMGGRSKELQDSHVSNIWQHEVELRRAIMTALSQFEACLNSRPLGTIIAS